jgi:hypothetical protein
MSEKISPKMCAVCGISLDQVGGQWFHIRELVGKSDHVAVPVDYDPAQVRAMCDFCYLEIPRDDIWTVLAQDFQIPIIGTMSAGNWAACSTCVGYVRLGAWSALVDHAGTEYTRRNGGNPTEIKMWLTALYERLSKNLTDPPRKWQPGDEEVNG